MSGFGDEVSLRVSGRVVPEGISISFAEGTLVIKRKAIEVLRRTLLWVGRTAEGLFHLADESELAERIRTFTRRPLRRSEESASEESTPEASTSEESTGEPPDAPASRESDSGESTSVELPAS